MLTPHVVDCGRSVPLVELGCLCRIKNRPYQNSGGVFTVGLSNERHNSNVSAQARFTHGSDGASNMIKRSSGFELKRYVTIRSILDLNITISYFSNEVVASNSAMVASSLACT